MKYSVLIIAFNCLLITTSVAVAESTATPPRVNSYHIAVPGVTPDYKNGYLNGYLIGAKQTDQEGLENHKKRLEKAAANRRQAVEAARPNSSN